MIQNMSILKSNNKKNRSNNNRCYIVELFSIFNLNGEMTEQKIPYKGFCKECCMNLVAKPNFSVLVVIIYKCTTRAEKKLSFCNLLHRRLLMIDNFVERKLYNLIQKDISDLKK